MPTKVYSAETMARARQILSIAQLNDQTPHPSSNPQVREGYQKLRNAFLPEGERWPKSFDGVSGVKPISLEDFWARLPGWLQTRKAVHKELERGRKIKAASVLRLAHELARRADPSVPLRAVTAAWRQVYRPAKMQSGQYAKRDQRYALQWTLAWVHAQVLQGATINAAAVEAQRVFFQAATTYYRRDEVPSGSATKNLGATAKDLARPRWLVEVYCAAKSDPKHAYRPALEQVDNYAGKFPIDDAFLNALAEKALITLYDTDLELPIFCPPVDFTKADQRPAKAD